MADFTGMLQQLNSAVGRNPLAQQYNQSLPGMTPSPLDTVNPLLAGSVSKLSRGLGLSGDIATSPEKAAVSNKAMGAAVEGRDPQAMRAAASLLMQQGRQSEAIQLLQMAGEIEAKQMALLEEGKQEIEANVLQAKEEKALSMAKRLAETKGDQEAVRGLEGGLIAPKDYFEAMRQASASQEPVSLPDGAMLVGPDGRILVENKKDFRPSGPSESTGGVNLSSQEKKDITQYGRDAQKAFSVASRTETLATQFERAPPEAGGVFRTVDEAFASVTGNRDAISMALTDFYDLRNAQALGNLPPGSASDTDVALAMQGVPPDNATNAEIAKWLKHLAAAKKLQGKYHSFLADYVSNHGAAGADRAWNKKRTPIGDLRDLKKDPSLLSQFEDFYHWTPTAEELEGV